MADLRKFLAKAQAKPFCYGQHDCCIVAAAWLAENGRPDLRSAYAYKTLRDGLRLASEAGYQSPADAFERLCPRVVPLRASPGDLAVIDLPRVPAIGIVRPGGEDVFCIGSDGTRIVPITAATYCLKVV
jgi:hypothetical protein